MVQKAQKSVLFQSTALVMALSATTVLLSGCGKQISPNTYSEAHVGEASRTFRGIVVSVREVNIQAHERIQDNTTGGLIGGVAGGVAGAQFGQGRGQLAAGAAGALLGAAVGAFAEQEMSGQTGLEYVIELANGEMRTVVQGLDVRFNPGQAILLMVGVEGRSRIVADQSGGSMYPAQPMKAQKVAPVKRR